MAKFNLERAIAATSRKRVRGDTTHAMVITSVEPFEKEGQSQLKAVADVQVIRDIEDPNSLVPGTEHKAWISVPLPNPEDETNIPEEGSYRSFCGWASALFPEEVPAWPAKRSRGRNEPYFFEGEEIETDQYQECKNTSLAKAGAKAEELLEERYAGMVGRPFHSYVKYNKKGFLNHYPKYELRDDDEVCDPEEALEPVPVKS